MPCRGALVRTGGRAALLRAACAPACGGRRRSAGGSTSTRRRSTSRSTAPPPSMSTHRCRRWWRCAAPICRVDPQARLDRDRGARASSQDPGATVTRVSLSRRDGRRFVHVSIDVDDVRRLSQAARRLPGPAIGSIARDDALEFRAGGGRRGRQAVGDVGWDRRRGGAVPRARARARSCSTTRAAACERGNILEWDQPLAERAERRRRWRWSSRWSRESILYSTLLLFGGTIVAAALAFAIAIWLLVRKGRRADIIERPADLERESLVGRAA